jgi:tetratricopeptide (TPR) repeat protein
MGRWAEAVLHYRRALEVRTWERDPRGWAATLQNLGAACRQAGDCRGAIGCYRFALRVFTAARNPARYAALHNNIGNAYLSMPGTRNAQRALRHLERALAFRTRAAAPADYAVTQLNRGTAFARLQLPALASASFREAHECFAASGQKERAALAHALALCAEGAAA